MGKEYQNVTLRLPVVLVKILDILIQQQDEKAGAQVWSRTKLIEKAVREYYAEEIATIHSQNNQGGQQIAKSK